MGAYYKKALVFLFLFTVVVLANTEPFVITLPPQTQYREYDNNRHNYLENDLYIYLIGKDQLDKTSEYYVDLSESSNVSLIFDVNKLSCPDIECSYFIRVCWSAIYPINMDLSFDEDKQFFNINIIKDAYGTNTTQIEQLMQKIPVQITINYNKFFNVISPQLLYLSGYIGLVTILSILFSFVVV
jgi:hypothetical protein